MGVSNLVIKKKFLFILSQLFKEERNIINSFEKIFDEGFSFKGIVNINDNLQFFKKKNKIKSSFYSHYNFIIHVLKTKILFFKKFNKNKKRINPRKGLMIAIIGSDGSGKSTLINNLKIEFSKKIDVRNFYLGSPKNNKTSFLPWVKIITRLGLKAVWNLLIKKINLGMAINERNKGLLVLCDRFPQSKYQKMIDGPRVLDNIKSNNLLKRWFSNLEKKEFEKMYNSKIDLIIKLKVNKKISSLRGGLSLELAEMKTKAIENLTFPNCNQKYELDANSYSAEQIKIQTMNIIWKNMS